MDKSLAAPTPEQPTFRSYQLAVGITIVIMALVLLYYGFVWGNVSVFVTALDHCDQLFCDFILQYYPTGNQLLLSDTPSKGYFYTSFFALFLYLFGSLPLETALWWWGAFQFLGAAFLLLLPGIYFWQRSKRAYFLYLLLFILSVPLLHNLKWGQLSAWITWFTFATFYWYDKGYKFLAALVLALATSIKYVSGIFLIYFLLKKEWRFIATYILLILLFVAVIPVIILGLEHNIAFYQFVNGRIAHVRANRIPFDMNSQYVVHVLSRYLSSWTDTPPEALFLRIIGILIFLLNVVLLYLVIKRGKVGDGYWAFCLFSLSTPFLLDTSWPHYFVYLPFCQVFLFLALFQRNQNSLSFVITALLIGGSMLLTNVIYFNFFPDWEVYSRLGNLFLANGLALLATYLVLGRIREDHA